MGKAIIFSLAKSSAAGVAVFSIAGFMGLPVSDPWFDFLMLYILFRNFLVSVVNGMPEPDINSSPWYIWAYRSLHSMARISTAYFSHKKMWKFISGDRDE